MRFNHLNTRGATVYDVESGEQIHRVTEVDTKNGWLKAIPERVRLNPQGKPMIERLRFSSIYPIYAGKSMPVMFHCYGRQK